MDMCDTGDASEKPFRCSNDNDEWIDDCDENKSTVKPVLSRFKVSNTVQSNLLLSDESINSLLIKDHCIKSRNSSTCPNDGECGECFGPIKSAREIMRDFRKKYWDKAGDSGHIFQRRKQLLQDIDNMKVLSKENSHIQIQYKIDGVFVCKAFFCVSVIL